MKLQGKVAVITGGSAGIGFGCAWVFGKHGCTVVIGSRGQEAGWAAEKQLINAGCMALFVPTDVTVESDMARLIDASVEWFGRLDCMVNNAGWHPPGETIDQVSIDDFEQLLRLNLTSTFCGCKLSVPHLRKTRGSIINMSSEAGVFGLLRNVRIPSR